MRRMTGRAITMLGLLVAATVSVPLTAAATDATLYELTENMMLDDLGKPTLRTASAALQGTAKVGTPICPAALMAFLAANGLPTGRKCTITAFGSNAVNLEAGTGSFWGNFAVVVNTDNQADDAEMVVMTGTFRANMQLQVDPKTMQPLPLISILDGKLQVSDVFGVPVAYLGMIGLDPEDFQGSAFGGVFRLPFQLDRTGRRFRARFDDDDAFYLNDKGHRIKVQNKERALGVATVRAEIDF